MNHQATNSRERQSLVHDLVLHHGELKAGDIAAKLTISLATVRRDLAALEGHRDRGALNSYSYELVGDMVN